VQVREVNIIKEGKKGRIKEKKKDKRFKEKDY
jgi:hypothetical protein